MLIAAVDIGGTAIKYGVVDERGTVRFHSSTPTFPNGPDTHVMNRVFDVCDELTQTHELAGIGISTAGQVDPVHGVITYATDAIPDYAGTQVAGLIKARYGLPVAVENDVNCMAIGELWQGAAIGHPTFLSLAIGTGIGGAIVINGELFRGVSNSAGEFGHIPVTKGGLPCACGIKGCFQAYASSLALQERFEALRNQSFVDLEQEFRRAKQGDQEAEVVIDDWVDHLAMGLQAFVHIFNPSLILIGGGITGQGDYLLKKIRAKTKVRIMRSFEKELTIAFAQHKNQANLLGAVYPFLHQE